MSGLFTRLASEWDDFSTTPHEFVVEGERVIVFGRYKEVYKATGTALDIPFVHSWTVKGGKLVAFQQYTDTAALVAAMMPVRALDADRQQHRARRIRQASHDQR